MASLLFAAPGQLERVELPKLALILVFSSRPIPHGIRFL
jgi:hypothetical protein